MNGEEHTEVPTTTRAAPRKPRPEIQIYRPGMLRQGGSTKSLAPSTAQTTTNDDHRPPRPEKLMTSSSSNATSTSSSSRRRSNDTDSVTSRGGSGSTTPDANLMNERGVSGRNRFERGATDNNRRGGKNDGGPSNYNSTQSLYDTRQQGGYMEYDGGNNRSTRGGGRYSNNHPHQSQQHQRQPFERPITGNYSRGFNERASMRGDGAIARRPQGSRRQRNDSINSTQSEMPPQTGSQLHIDTSFDSVSQCGASSNFSMNSLGEAFSFEEMCQNLQNFASMDWSKEVENEFAMQKEQEEEEERRLKEQEEEIQKTSTTMTSGTKKPRRNNRRNGRYQPDESDRESSFGGSIAEEAEDQEEELKSGERTPTSVRSAQSYNPRAMYQRTRGTGSGNDENQHQGRREAPPKKEISKKEPKKYRGEHDDRDDDATEYSSIESHMTTGRLAGRISIVQRAQNSEPSGHRNRQHTKADDMPKTYQKRSQAQSEMATRAELNRRRQEEIDRNEGKTIREISEKMDKLSGLVKKRDLKAAEKISGYSMELSNIYGQIILQDVIYSFTAGLEQKLFRQAFYKSIECLRSGSNSTSPDARLIRAVTQKLLLNGILFYEQLIATYEQQFHVELNETLTWPNGFPTDDELCSDGVQLPIGIQKYESSTQKTAIKSLSRHLISLGDLHRYKSLIDGSENYETSKSCYQKSSQLWPSTGHPYNQLGIVVYYSMLYRSARRCRLVPVDVLSKQRQKRVIDEFFYLIRALACSHPYEVAKDRLKQRLDAMRAKVSKYQPVLDKEYGTVKEQGNELRRLQCIRQIWIHPITDTIKDETREKVMKNDLLSHFMEHSKAKLHRRAVSYLCDTFGMLITKIGMDHFESVSERAFGLFYASLSKSETDFSPDQLLKLAVMFIYAVQTNFEKVSTSSSDFQFQISANTLITFFLTLLDHISTHKTIILPAVNVIATWILHAETDEILKTLRHLEPLESTIFSDFQGFHVVLNEFSEEKMDENAAESAYPEAILLASFFKIFEPNPTATKNSRITNMINAVKKLKNMGNFMQKPGKSAEEQNEEQDLEVSGEYEEPKSREQIIEEERDKGKGVIVIHPQYLITDTNVFIGELQQVKNLLETLQKVEKLQLLVPTTVIDELQNISKFDLKTSTNSESSHDPERCSKAKIALNWLKDQSRQKTNNLYTLTMTGKRLPSLLMATTENLEEFANMTNDDMILNSAQKWSESLPAPSTSSILHQIATSTTSSEKPILRNCVLITGDRGLTIKAIGNNFPCCGIMNFSKWMGV